MTKNKSQNPTSELDELVEEIVDELDMDEPMFGWTQNKEILKQFLKYTQDKVRSETAIEIIEFLDKLEMDQPEDLKTDNWRNWKYIRNSIVDKYKILTQLRLPSIKGDV